LKSFGVRATPHGLPPTTRPDGEQLAAEIVRGAGRREVTEPVPDAQITFDDVASPWYTLCEVRVSDRPRLLHTITVAFASAGADVHSARLRTDDWVAIDRFELTDRTGRKLDTETKRAIERALASGVTPRRRRLSTRR
jgi:UTP:GlnB (protein PII) uridylyltransferase